MSAGSSALYCAWGTVPHAYGPCVHVCAAAGDASAAARLAAARDEWELCGGPESERTITNVLTGLGFRPEQFHTPCSAFSGGWQVRG